MSVSSGVPVFRNKDGSMSKDFLKFLSDYNIARKSKGLEEVDDWFGFSVPEMFNKETEKEAWAYWRWRKLRALVEPAEDYLLLMQLITWFGQENSFVITSNCDQLHEKSGMHEHQIQEIHGSLGRFQCSKPCGNDLFILEESSIKRLEEDPLWVPRCPRCKDACLRPNVMIFDDDKLIDDYLDQQNFNLKQFLDRFRVSSPSSESIEKEEEKLRNLIVLEIGAGVVVPSIRLKAERLAKDGQGLVRINPTTAESLSVQLLDKKDLDKYCPLISRSDEALHCIMSEIKLEREKQCM